LVAFLFLVLITLTSRERVRPSKNEEVAQDSETPFVAETDETKRLGNNRSDNEPNSSLLHSSTTRTQSMNRVIFYSCLFMIFYSGTVIIYNQFMPSFLQVRLKVSSLTASLIHSSLNYSSTFSRGLGIFIAFKVAPQYMVLGNLILFNCGSLFLLVMSSLEWTLACPDRIQAVSYLGNMMIGLGMGSVSAPLYSFLKKHVEVTNVTGSVFVFCNGFTSVFVPLLVASVMTSTSSFLLYFNVFNMSLAIIIFIFILVRVKRETNENLTTT